MNLTRKNSSPVEVQNVSSHGLWIWVKGKEYFLSHQTFPWFQKAPLEKVFHVELQHEKHLYWPDLDVDLSIASLENPEDFPLVAS